MPRCCRSYLNLSGIWARRALQQSASARAVKCFSCVQVSWTCGWTFWSFITLTWCRYLLLCVHINFYVVFGLRLTGTNTYSYDGSMDFCMCGLTYACAYVGMVHFALASNAAAWARYSVIAWNPRSDLTCFLVIWVTGRLVLDHGIPRDLAGVVGLQGDHLKPQISQSCISLRQLT